MDYQSIRAAVENPILTAFTNLSPAVPVFFDNITVFVFKTIVIITIRGGGISYDIQTVQVSVEMVIWVY